MVVNILFGGSNAGLFAVYTLIEHQEIIQAGIAGSPMIGHCSDFMFNQLKKALENNYEKDRYLYMIYGENDSKRVVDYVRKYFDLLKSRVAVNFKTENVILKNEGHVPVSSLHNGLLFIFQDYNK
jgi:predicted alpha/beta superfamily hydrolase